jgi:hypothetical protein
MPDYTDDDALDDEYSMMQDDEDEDDDFNNFDPARYLRKRRGGRTYGNVDAEPGVAGDDDLIGYRARRSGAARGRLPVIDAADREPGMLQLLLGGLGPNLRTIVFGLGCFVVLLCIGACALALWAINTLANR